MTDDAMVLKVLREQYRLERLSKLDLAHAQVQRHLIATTKSAIQCGALLSYDDALDLIRTVKIEPWLVEIYYRLATVDEDITYRATRGKISIREAYGTLYKSGVVECLRRYLENDGI